MALYGRWSKASTTQSKNTCIEKPDIINKNRWVWVMGRRKCFLKYRDLGSKTVVTERNSVDWTQPRKNEWTSRKIWELDLEFRRGR